MSTLEIKDLHVHVETKEGIKPILKGANLTVHSGETHAIMGPNGSGKSTLAYTLAGHPKYVVDSGEALLDGQDILKMTPDERAKAGLFLAMQYPVEVPGVSMTNFLRTAKTEIDGEAPGIRQWAKDLSAAMKRLKMDPKFASRSVNEGFSGTRILKYIKPDIVHVFADGHFVKTGGPELADELEENGYDQYLPEGADSESALA